MNKESKYYIGIDLGTTNSLIAWGRIDPITNQISAQIVPINMWVEKGAMAKRDLLPSFVYFKEETSPIVGEYAKVMIGRQSNRIVKSVKSDMGSTTSRTFDGKPYSPQEISALILKHLINAAKESFRFVPDDIVITVPASFDPDMRNATIQAAKLAGIRTTEADGSPRNILFDEPRAALYDFVNRHQRGEIPDSLIDFQSPKIILVFDLGGGTLDVSLHNVYYDDKKSLNIADYAISRHTPLGGDDFDDLLAKYFLEKYAKKIPFQSLSDADKTDLKAKFRLFAEYAKIELSCEVEHRKTTFGENEFSSVTTEITQQPFENKPFGYSLRWNEYEEIIFPLLADHLSISDAEKFEQIPFTGDDNIIYPILDVLDKAKKKLGVLPKIDAVLLNGGMTKLYSIQKRLEHFFGFKPITAGEQDKAVARGAVIYHYDLHRGIKPAKILNETIGLETQRRVAHLVRAGTILPYSSEVMKDFKIQYDNTASIELPFYLGNRTDTNPPNRKLAVRYVKFSKPLNAEEPIHIKLTVDERGMMTLKGWSDNHPEIEFTITDIITDGPNTNEPLQPSPKNDHILKTSSLSKPKGPKLAVPHIVRELSVLYDRHERGEKTVMHQIRGIEKNIINAENYDEFIPVFLKNIDRHNKNFEKARLFLLLGWLCAQCPQDSHYPIDVCQKAMEISTPEKIKIHEQEKITSFVNYAIVTIGRIGLSMAESHLINLLSQDKVDPIKDTIIHSLGKIGHSVNTLKHLKTLIQSSKDAERIAAYWAFGRLGSRERQPVLPIEQFQEIIDKLVRQLKQEDHPVAKRNCIYALGEIGDRRNQQEGNIIDAQKGKEFIAVIENIENSLKNTSTIKTVHKRMIQKMAALAITMIKGELPTKEQEHLLQKQRNLLGDRGLIGESNEVYHTEFSQGLQDAIHDVPSGK